MLKLKYDFEKIFVRIYANKKNCRSILFYKFWIKIFISTRAALARNFY